MKRKKEIILLVFFVSVFFMLPVSAILAENSQKGNPEVVVVSSELRVPEEMQKLSGNTTISDAVYFLDVKLEATKHSALYVNGTVSFKDNLRDYYTVNGLRVNENLSITTHFAVWSELQMNERKESGSPFVIVGLNYLPEKITFILELTSVNPYDEVAYSQIVEFSVLTDSASIDITSISNPAEYYKGYKVPVTVYVKNTGDETISGYATIYVSVKSTQAEGSTLPFKNDDGSIILTDVKTFSTTINPGQTKSFYFQIDYCDYSNGAMNVGEWKICQVTVIIGTAVDNVHESHPDFNQHISDPYYNVHARTKGMQPHPVFIYYLWNSGGTGGDWGGTNPKPYFMDGYGNVLAGLKRFQNYGSNIPVAFKMIICYDDSTWSIPMGKDDGEMFDHGKTYAGDDQLNSIYDDWDDVPYKISVYNCGFDILLMAAGRNSGGAEGMAFQNRAIIFMSGSITHNSYWKKNIDGVAQHEISHLFGCNDVIHGHTFTSCIMCYKPWFPIYYQFEVCIWTWCYQLDRWCTLSGSNHCQYKFDNNWGIFYSC